MRNEERQRHRDGETDEEASWAFSCRHPGCVAYLRSGAVQRCINFSWWKREANGTTMESSRGFCAALAGDLIGALDSPWCDNSVLQTSLVHLACLARKGKAWPATTKGQKMHRGPRGAERSIPNTIKDHQSQRESCGTPQLRCYCVHLGHIPPHILLNV